MVVMLLYCGVIALMLIGDVWYVNWSDFKTVLAAKTMRTAMLLTLITSVITTALSVLVAVPTAYALGRLRPRGSALADTLIDICIVLPPIVLGLSILAAFRMGRDWDVTNYLLFDSLLGSDWMLLHWLGTALGWLGACLQGIGSAVAWLGSVFTFTRPGIVLAQFSCSAAYAVRVIKAALDDVDPRSEAVAMTLGCSRGKAFALVTLPQIKAGVAAGAVLAWARAVGLFGTVEIVAGAVPNKTQVLPTAIYNEISNAKLRQALAASLMMVVFAMVVLLVFRFCTRMTLFGKGAAE